MTDAIKDFYVDVSLDGVSPTYTQVMNADYDWIESTHNWCQRAFPNFEASELVEGAPVLDDATLLVIKRFHKEKVLNLVFRYLRHFNDIGHTDPKHYYHNNRRVTRLLKFLNMLELNDALEVAYNTVTASEDGNPGFDNALMYWQEALYYKREQ
jgi:hypothetical protein